jgi:NTE family protein
MSFTEQKHISVALQGGGSHGAFTWGVLERLLEEKKLHLDGFCGTSAGAVNAVLLAYGLQLGNRETAKDLLNTFWSEVGSYGQFSPIQPSVFDLWFGKRGNLDYSFGYAAAEMLTNFFSPYQINPFNINPLGSILKGLVNFEKLKNCDVTKIFICATNVKKGRVKVFNTCDISLDAVMASCCIPQFNAAVEIDGEYYWDGGFMGNPPIFPLITGTNCKDILLVQINPINIPDVPTSASKIQDRISELSFNSSLMLEMRKFDLIDRLLEEGIDLGGKFRKVFMHHINPEERFGDLNMSSKMNISWDFIHYLRKNGNEYAEKWLSENFDNIGKASTCDVRENFL